MKTIEVNQATASLAEYAKEMNQEPLILTIDGRPVAALVSIQNADLETIRLSTDPQFIALIERSRARQDQEGGISSADMRRKLRIK